MKLLALAVLIFSASLVLSSFIYRQGRSIRSDQGYVNDGNGNEWRLKRMQTLGMTNEFVAVYESEKEGLR